MNNVKQHQVLPLKKRYFKNHEVAVTYFEKFTGYNYERAKTEADIPWNIWPVEEGAYKYFIGTAGEWIEGGLDTNLN